MLAVGLVATVPIVGDIATYVGREDRWKLSEIMFTYDLDITVYFHLPTSVEERMLKAWLQRLQFSFCFSYYVEEKVC